MSIIRRTQLELELGLQPMSGEIKKHRQFVNGVPTSYVSVNLNHLLPQDVDIVFSMLRSELEGVTKDKEEARQLLTSETRWDGQ